MPPTNTQNNLSAEPTSASTPKGNRLHIALFGATNAGKSSLINALTGQNIAIVSPVAGTTTDPVQKAMEILPIGPVLLIDTAGLDDTGELGQLRIAKSLSMLSVTDVALLVVTAKDALQDAELNLIENLRQKNIPFAIVINKTDILAASDAFITDLNRYNAPLVSVSALTGLGIDELKQTLIKIAAEKIADINLLDDLVSAGDTVILVTPIDSAAPKGRLILPQVQVLRAILDKDAMAFTVKEDKLSEALAALTSPPKLVITDSQVFALVDKILPADINLTSFSILFARQKGDLQTFIDGARAIDSLTDGANILVAEACTHYRTHEDIGTVKIPALLRKHTGLNLNFTHVVGYDFPDDLSDYQLVIHCGACMINRAAMLSRMAQISKQHLPVVNYGMVIAYTAGILKRSLSPFVNLSL